MARKGEPTGIRRLWQEYGLSIALFGLFAVSFVLHTISGWYEYAADQQAHGEAATLFGDSGYAWSWAEWTLQNWQSEFLELGMIVVLSSVLIHRGSAESKDTEDEIKALLTEIEGKLARLEAGDRPDRDATKKRAS